MRKGRSKDKLVKLSLGRRALALIQDAPREGDSQQGNIFTEAMGQQSNIAMEEIRQELGIKSKLHSHVGRESFAMLYLENSGNLEVLEEYLYHSLIETTIKYVHVSDARKPHDLDKVDAIFKRQRSEAQSTL